MKKIVQITSESIRESAILMKDRLMIMGMLGAIAFPLFYFIWTFFQEKYENLPLRTVGSLLCIILALYSYWPRRLQKYYVPYYTFTATYCLPFFFIFMTLKNSFSPVWNGSLIACYTILAGFVDWAALGFFFITGTILSTLTFIALEGLPAFLALGEYRHYLPIYIFVLVFSTYFSYRSSLVKKEKENVLNIQAAHLAHELKRPLTGIRIALKGAEKIMCTPVYETRLVIRTIREARLECENAINLFDILVMNAAAGESISRSSFTVCSAGDCVRRALRQFPYRSRVEKAIVQCDIKEDFQYFGSELLCLHIIFNLLKNSLDSIFRKGHGIVRVTTEQGRHFNHISVYDTGEGIEENNLKYIFNKFFTTGKPTGGQGLGLAFVKIAMEYFGGKVKAESVFAESTRITLYFPKLSGDT